MFLLGDVATEAQPVKITANRARARTCWRGLRVNVKGREHLDLSPGIGMVSVGRRFHWRCLADGCCHFCTIKAVVIIDAIQVFRCTHIVAIVFLNSNCIKESLLKGHLPGPVLDDIHKLILAATRGWRWADRWSVWDGDGEGLADVDGEEDGAREMEGEMDMEGVIEGVAEGESDTDGVTEGVAERDGVTDGVGEGDGVTDGVEEGDGVTDEVGEGDGEGAM